MYFWTNGIPKTWLDKCLKSLVLEDPLSSNMVTRETLLKSSRQHLRHICWSLWRIFSWKKSPLVRCKILALFVNTFTDGAKYSLLNRDNLLQHLQKQYFQKQNTVSEFLTALFKSKFNFEHFQKIDQPHRWCILQLTYSKQCCEINV